MIRIEDINVKGDNKSEKLKIPDDVLQNIKVEICKNKIIK